MNKGAAGSLILVCTVASLLGCASLPQNAPQAPPRTGPNSVPVGDNKSPTAPTIAPQASQPARDAATVTTPESTVTTDNPKLSAEEIGKRFLKLIEGLKSRNDLNVERVQEATGLPLEHVPPSSGGTEYYAYTQPLEGGWEYLLRYFLRSKSIHEGIGLAFIHKEERYADMTAICLPHEDYHSALKAMGFLDVPIYGEIGQLISWRYYRDNITLSVISRNPKTGRQDLPRLRGVHRHAQWTMTKEESLLWQTPTSSWQAPIVA